MNANKRWQYLPATPAGPGGHRWPTARASFSSRRSARRPTHKTRSRSARNGEEREGGRQGPLLPFLVHQTTVLSKHVRGVVRIEHRHLLLRRTAPNLRPAGRRKGTAFSIRGLEFTSRREAQSPRTPVSILRKP
jgi:hypothetical protein